MGRLFSIGSISDVHHQTESLSEKKRGQFTGHILVQDIILVDHVVDQLSTVPVHHKDLPLSSTCLISREVIIP